VSVGGTLLLSREKQLYPYFQKRFTELGFANFEIAGEERDSLNSLINDMKPQLVLVGCEFFKCSTPYMMGKLLKNFPKLNSAVVSVFHKIPDDLAMWFIFNGVKSYINFFDGPDEFYRGLNMVKEGQNYISPGVLEQMNKRREIPEPAGNVTSRQMEIIRLVCNGFTGQEICNELAIAEDTLYVQKRKIYTYLNVRNENELIRVALLQKWISLEELSFFGREYRLSPLPEKSKNPVIKQIHKAKKSCYS
jgi:DNA-binding NarL/FixJ family response regulator